MKVLVPDFKKGVKVAIDGPEDLWYLSQIIEAGDQISGKTERKIKLGGEGENTKILKKHLFLRILVEKIDFGKQSGVLRASGKVVSESEDVPKGSHHTFDIAEGETVTIEKADWPKYQKDRVFEAARDHTGKVIVVILERDEAEFFLLKRYGYEKLLELSGDVPKKAMDSSKENTFFSDIIKKIEEYDARFSLDKIIIASPAFWKEDLIKLIKNDKLKPKIIAATCSASRNAIEEVLKRPEVAGILAQEKSLLEGKIVDELLSEIGKDKNASYGEKEVALAADSGAVSRLIITDGLIQKRRENEDFHSLDKIMKAADKAGAEIRIISSENDAGKKLDGLGGIGAILRYKLSY